MTSDGNRCYFRSDDCRTFRIVQTLHGDCFVVVKVFEGGVRTVKFWRGDLYTCAKHWRTKQFTPTAQAKRLLDVEFDCTIQEFGPAFNAALTFSA